MPGPDQPDAPAPPQPSVKFEAFAGLRNTVTPEKLGPRDLARAQNIDLDDEGQPHRRRGQTLAVAGAFHSLFETTIGVLAIKDGMLVLIEPGYQIINLMPGFSKTLPMAYVQVGPVVYFSSKNSSGQLDLPSLKITGWCRARGPAYVPGLKPGDGDFWFSPVANVEPTLGAIGGKLLGPPPMATALTWFNGRIYLASGKTLWATELYLYNYVDKNKGNRLFESDITVVGAVEDGVYVGTQDGLYFLSGAFGEHIRTLREKGAVYPGSMVQVPGELSLPDTRIRPELPHVGSKSLSVMTANGIVICTAGGQTFNLTRTNYLFPGARRSPVLFRQQDGMNTLIHAMDSGGTPENNARFGDHLSAVLVRDGVVIDADGAALPTVQDATRGIFAPGAGPEVQVQDLEGDDIFRALQQSDGATVTNLAGDPLFKGDT